MERISLIRRLLLYCLLPVLAACHRKAETAETPERFYAEPEGYFRLDSTTVGIHTVITGLNVPWEITWGPDGWIWYSAIGGEVGKVNPQTGQRKVLLQLKDVFTRTTPGLLGMAVHPDQKHSPYLFLLYTLKQGEEIILNAVRYTLEGDNCINPKVLLQIPGGLGHNGARIKIGADGYLYIATGEATAPEKAQDKSELGGKVLRINIDGTAAAGNPYPGNPVWASGFRNPQGLALTPDGRIYLSDHGEASDDEVNLITKGGNYGWPDVRGYCDTDPEKEYCAATGITTPLKAWTPTIAPAGIAYYEGEAIPEWKNTLLLTTLKGASLRILHLDTAEAAIPSETVLFAGIFGRLRDVCISPAGDVYLSTSNRDWNPLFDPGEGDDRIIRLFNLGQTTLPDSIQQYFPSEAPAGGAAGTLSGARLYTDFCSACHKANGKGIAGTFPSLRTSPLVSASDPEALIRTVLDGLSTAPEPMPAFGFLTDGEIAAVLSYVRTQFGENEGPVSAEDVKQLR